ncbi:MAG: AAA family ATPase [Chloroflexi bacterium]|nr:AAA family ATPase [Chloroflexota bacterium]
MVKRSGDIIAGPTAVRQVRPKAASPFVGRDEELRRLTTSLDLAAGGEGSVVFLTGEPGIGKTRLAVETLALAKERGFTVLGGRAYPLEVGLAYAPLVDAFRPLLRNVDSARLQRLVSDLPSLGHLFDGLRLAPAFFPSEGLNDPALEKTRLFEAVARFVERLTCEAPVALFIDDLHWADAATLELLHYLARGLSDQAALLFAAYRRESLDTSHRLRELVEPLQRVGLAEEMALSRLKGEATDKLVCSILGGEAPKGLVSLLEARARGTPLFIMALLDNLIQSGSLVRGSSENDVWVFDAAGTASLPPTVRRLILERVDRLAGLERRVMDLLAIMGDTTSHAVLRAASGVEDEPLLGALRRLRGAGLVADGVDGSEVTYSITHPLIQEVAYSELPEMERRRAHLTAIRALEAQSEGRTDGVSRLARHYLGAGTEADPERALGALVAAGERALQLYANEEAARYFEAALAMLRKGGGDGLSTAPRGHPPQPSTLSHVLERLGEALELTGKPEAAIDAWKEALVLLSEPWGHVADAARIARLHHRLALAEFYRYRLDEARAHVESGLKALAGREPCQELADLHWVRYHILFRIGDTGGVGETTRELLSLAQRLASPRAEAEANMAASMFSLRQNDIAQARQYSLRALTIAESIPGGPDLANCCRAHIGLIMTGMCLGDHHFMRYHGERGLAAARRLGAPHMEIHLCHYLAFAHLIGGVWEEAQRRSTEAVLLARRLGQPRDLAHALAGRALILALQGDPSEAKACVSEVRTSFGSPSKEGSVDRHVFGLIDMAETALALEQGQAERALAVAGGFRVEGLGLRMESPPLSIAPRGRPPQPSALELPDRPMGFTLLAEAQVAAGYPESALETAHQIFDLGPTGTPYFTALAARVEGLARRALGQREAALECLARASEGFASLEMPVEAARCLLEQAELEGQAQAAQESLTVFDRCGAGIHSERARLLLRELGVLPVVRGRSRFRGVPLSERELDVARLVAEGLTTAEIASRLNLSWRTVNAHLGHIYARLGIGSRAALTRYVIEVGLLSPLHERSRDR